MDDEKYKRIREVFLRINDEAAVIVGGNPNGIFLYVEAGNGWIGSSLFRDEGVAIKYYRSSMELDRAISDAREEEERPHMRWSVMEFAVENDKFQVRFKFPEEVDVEKFDENRRDGVLQARFGEREITYPPFPK